MLSDMNITDPREGARLILRRAGDTGGWGVLHGSNAVLVAVFAYLWLCGEIDSANTRQSGIEDTLYKILSITEKSAGVKPRCLTMIPGMLSLSPSEPF